jgi:hypothetical protein
MPVMPLELGKLIKQLKQQGYAVERTANGHYLVANGQGRVIISFAASHSRSGRREEVYDNYLQRIRKAIVAEQQGAP